MMRRAGIVLASTSLIVISSAIGQQTSDTHAMAEAAIRTADAAGLKAAQAKDVAGATANF
jgi:hypothetical protein